MFLGNVLSSGLRRAIGSRYVILTTNSTAQSVESLVAQCAMRANFNPKPIVRALHRISTGLDCSQSKSKGEESRTVQSKKRFEESSFWRGQCTDENATYCSKETSLESEVKNTGANTFRMWWITPKCRLLVFTDSRNRNCTHAFRPSCNEGIHQHVSLWCWSSNLLILQKQERRQNGVDKVFVADNGHQQLNAAANFLQRDLKQGASVVCSFQN